MRHSAGHAHFRKADADRLGVEDLHAGRRRQDPWGPPRRISAPPRGAADDLRPRVSSTRARMVLTVMPRISSPAGGDVGAVDPDRPDVVDEAVEAMGAQEPPRIGHMRKLAPVQRRPDPPASRPRAAPCARARSPGCRPRAACRPRPARTCCWRSSRSLSCSARPRRSSARSRASPLGHVVQPAERALRSDGQEYVELFRSSGKPISTLVPGRRIAVEEFLDRRHVVGRLRLWRVLRRLIDDEDAHEEVSRFSM